MKTQQLANVFIKILGIYFILQYMTRFIAELFSSLAMYIVHKDLQSLLIVLYSLGIGSIFVFVISLLLIIKSKAIAGFLFKGEEY